MDSLRDTLRTALEGTHQRTSTWEAAARGLVASADRSGSSCRRTRRTAAKASTALAARVRRSSRTVDAALRRRLRATKSLRDGLAAAASSARDAAAALGRATDQADEAAE
eukprot:Rhum_TRINITY_DN4969_c0_g1::Rhum_TRINITY_DN4969_c0_g1_i1::g.16201::m.16201